MECFSRIRVVSRVATDILEFTSALGCCFATTIVSLRKPKIEKILEKRERDRDRKKEREIRRETESQRNRQRHTDAEKDTERETGGEKERDRDSGLESD